MIDILDWVGRVTTILFLITLGLGIWARGIFPALIRLGFGLSRRKIAIFAKGDNLLSLKNLLLDSTLFRQKNMLEITSADDLGIAERATLYLVFWHDWSEYIEKILEGKKDGTALPAGPLACSSTGATVSFWVR